MITERGLLLIVYRYGIKGLEYSMIEAYNSLPNHVKRLQPVLPKNCKKIIDAVFSV